jgi:four helix bundle protein
MMTFEEWLAAVPEELAGDPLWRMEAYRLALFAGDLAWYDVCKLAQDKRTISLADQLFRAAGSVHANISEGYSHRSGKDQARFYEYALGSGREARGWYWQVRHVLTEEVTMHRMRLLTRVARLLLTMIPSERGYKISEEPARYDTTSGSDDLLSRVPMPLPVIGTRNTQHATRTPPACDLP